MQGIEAQVIAVVIFIIVVLFFFYKPKWKASGTAHGTARWATEADLRGKGMIDERS